MSRIYFNRRLWTIAVLSIAAIAANYLDSAVNSQEISQLPAVSANKMIRNKSDSSAQTLIGGWTYASVDDSGRDYQYTGFFEPDGTYSVFVTREAGAWFLGARGTWSFENGTLYQNSETGEQTQGAMNFPSQDKYRYKSSTTNIETTWQRIAPDPNLSAQQLVGTWAIEPLNIRNGQIVPDLSQFTKMELKLVELNADGTFRYQGSDLTVPGYLEEANNSGTWEYINNGFADGILVLKNTSGQTLSVSSVNWSNEGNYFVSINRGELDSELKLNFGKVEKFIPTDQRIN